MEVKKRCYCCNGNESVSIKKHFQKCEQIKLKNGPIVSLVRLEDDPKLLSYITEKNIITDFKNFRSVKKSVTRGSSKKVIGDDHHSECDINNHSSDVSGSKTLKEGITNINSMSFDFTMEGNVSTPSKINTTHNGRTSNIVSKSKPGKTVLMSDKTCERKLEDVSSACPVSLESVSQTKSKVEKKVSNDCSTQPKVTSIIPTSQDKSCSTKKVESVDNESEKSSLKRKIIPEIEEPLSLISKLTGCQIPPSKVKVLPLTTCISSPSTEERENDSTDTSKNTDENLLKKQNVPEVIKLNGDSLHSNGNVVSFDDKSKSCDRKDLTHPVSEKLDAAEEVRTVYDVMEYISVVMPSWNLHILSDTNTFCICQVTRSKSGIPHISKCIEFDDNFNGKVYVYQQHVKRFDGVYNSEDAVVALIKEVDAIR